MQYYSDSNQKGRNFAVAGTVLYGIVLAVLLLFVRFDVDYNPANEGILIDFGDSETGRGDAQVTLSHGSSANSRTETRPREEIMTQDFEDAATVEQQRPEDTRRNRPDRDDLSNTQSQQQGDVQQREVNQRALFPGVNQESEATSRGDGEQEGNQGHEAGAEGGQAQGTGAGNSGVSYDLAGRRPVGNLVSPEYPRSDSQGIVIIEVTVDSRGNVMTTAYRARGSTTQDNALISAARTAAQNTKFTPDENNAVQTGTITYVFRLTQ